MPALQREAAWAEPRLLGDLRQPVPQDGRVHLLGIDIGAQLKYSHCTLPGVGLKWT